MDVFNGLSAAESSSTTAISVSISTIHLATRCLLLLLLQVQLQLVTPSNVQPKKLVRSNNNNTKINGSGISGSGSRTVMKKHFPPANNKEQTMSTCPQKCICDNEMKSVRAILLLNCQNLAVKKLP